MRISDWSSDVCSSSPLSGRADQHEHDPVLCRRACAGDAAELLRTAATGRKAIVQLVKKAGPRIKSGVTKNEGRLVRPNHAVMKEGRTPRGARPSLATPNSSGGGSADRHAAEAIALLAHFLHIIIVDRKSTRLNSSH